MELSYIMSAMLKPSPQTVSLERNHMSNLRLNKNENIKFNGISDNFSIEEAKAKLENVYDRETKMIKSINVVKEVINKLENCRISKLELERTLIGRLLNEVRKSITDVETAKRTKSLIKQWQNVIAGKSTPKISTNQNGKSTKIANLPQELPKRPSLKIKIKPLLKKNNENPNVNINNTDLYQKKVKTTMELMGSLKRSGDLRINKSSSVKKIKYDIDKKCVEPINYALLANKRIKKVKKPKNGKSIDKMDDYSEISISTNVETLTNVSSPPEPELNVEMKDVCFSVNNIEPVSEPVSVVTTLFKPEIIEKLIVTPKIIEKPIVYRTLPTMKFLNEMDSKRAKENKPIFERSKKMFANLDIEYKDTDPMKELDLSKININDEGSDDKYYTIDIHRQFTHDGRRVSPVRIPKDRFKLNVPTKQTSMRNVKNSVDLVSRVNYYTSLFTPTDVSISESLNDTSSTLTALSAKFEATVVTPGTPLISHVAIIPPTISLETKNFYLNYENIVKLPPTTVTYESEKSIHPKNWTDDDKKFCKDISHRYLNTEWEGMNGISMDGKFTRWTEKIYTTSYDGYPMVLKPYVEK
ncbi:hypothetical protein A3Q56_00154 [Intoshia linei]|uniref:TFIIS N-terminal domain-containing protein n=1 Tax=Intoshia linei TaxID=1819745 RepID=A0A177BEE5_9BILA|nr:hypothetical protein A3Q56_00154 [Intoshia linei]